MWRMSEWSGVYPYRGLNLKSTISFLAFVSGGSKFLVPPKTVVSCDLLILITREYSSTLYVGLAHAVPPTNTNFQPLLLLTQEGMPYTNIHKHRTSYFKSTLTFIGLTKHWK